MVPDFRVIPSIERLRARTRVVDLESRYGAEATLAALRDAAAALRTRIATGGGDGFDTEAAASAIEGDATLRLVDTFRGSLRPVINATGVVVHTNLGRAPLAESAIARVAAAARGYTNLEYDLTRGARGSRTVHAEALITRLTGAEAAVVVNNNAAATMLILAGLAQGREVLISRGELVEIGGGFRVPDVMRQSGAILREVGTTNRTRVADYLASATAATAMLLRVHPSNFRVEGFTERPSLDALVAAGRTLGVPVVEDLGSGCVVEDLPWEAPVQASIRAGVSLVCFSGDKLLGGPQAGIVAGAASVVDRLRTHPLMRALRVDKLTLAALEGTLLEYAAGRGHNAVPVQRLIRLAPEAIEARARALAAALEGRGFDLALLSGSSAIGGGSAPGVTLPTVLLALSRAGQTADALEARLRALDPPVIARIEDQRVVLDLRTVLPGDDECLATLLASLDG